MIRKLLFAGVLSAGLMQAADQTQVGAGNARAEQIGKASPFIQSAKRLLLENVREVKDAALRKATLDALDNPKTCVAHRAGLTDEMKSAILQTLIAQQLVNPADAAQIEGGLKAGVFPPLNNDGSACPQLPLAFDATPGSSFGGHHSYPGGLAVHEAFNQQSAKNFAAAYRGDFGQTQSGGLPVMRGMAERADFNINQDVVLAAPAWHDWAKTMVFQWNADGTEFRELDFAGTSAHHIIGLAETMARGLSPALVITQASAHSAPTMGNESKVVNWLRAAAILARIDPVAKGYLTKDSNGHLRLGNLLPEYQIHNLSDADFVQSIPAVDAAQVLLAGIASRFGYDPANAATYNNSFRNVVLAYLSPERLEFLNNSLGLDAVVKEVTKLKQRSLL